MNSSASKTTADESAVDAIETSAFESFWDANGVFSGSPPSAEIMKETLSHLCMRMEYLRSWWSAHEELLRTIPEANAVRVHDMFVEGVIDARSLARWAGITVDTEFIHAYQWTRTPEEMLPEPPEVGPPPPYTWLGGNLGPGQEPPFIHVRTPEGRFDTSLSDALRRIDHFAEPGRSRILMMLPFLFDIPRPLTELGKTPLRQDDYFYRA